MHRLHQTSEIASNNVHTRNFSLSFHLEAHAVDVTNALIRVSFYIVSLIWSLPDSEASGAHLISLREMG